MMIEDGNDLHDYQIHPVPHPHLVSQPRLPHPSCSRCGGSSTSLGSSFQNLTTLSRKKFLLMPNLTLPWHFEEEKPQLLEQCYANRD